MISGYCARASAGEHPYRDGIALIGDAAASDPAYGQGMSLTLRDARVLREYLVTTEDGVRLLMPMRAITVIIIG
jgi:2-polyprenyl-6-methoxyphenol hydroxylase-like FAD-dependent oxidoreductase